MARTDKTFICDGVTIRYPGGTTQKAIRAIVRAADDGGTIQAVDMVRLFPGYDPRLHTTTSLTNALAILGATIED